MNYGILKILVFVFGAGPFWKMTQKIQEFSRESLGQMSLIYISGFQADVPDTLVRKFWDLVQPAIGCCGVTSWMDWTKGDSGLNLIKLSLFQPYINISNNNFL